MKKNKLKESEYYEDDADSNQATSVHRKKSQHSARGKEKAKHVSKLASRLRPKPLKRSKSEKLDNSSKKLSKTVLKQQKLKLSKAGKTSTKENTFKVQEDSQDSQSVSSAKSLSEPDPALKNNQLFEYEEDSSIKEAPGSLNCVSLNEDSEKGSTLSFKNVSIEKLIKLKEKIRETTMEKLCKVLRFLKKRNPESIIQTDERVMIYLEKLTYQTFHEVWDIVIGEEEALESNEDHQSVI